MKEEFLAYLNDLRASSVVISRVENLIDLLHEIVTIEFTGIFLNDFITQDGIMQFDALYLFSDREIIQAKNFLQMDNFEFGGYKEAISSIEIQGQDYNFKTTSEKSRFTISLNCVVGARYYQFKASKQNCNYLKSIYDVYLRPNIVDVTTPDRVVIVRS
jgi:hypothetical protein